GASGRPRARTRRPRETRDRDRPRARSDTATRRRCGRARTSRRLPPGGRSIRRPRSDPPRGRARPAPRARPPGRSPPPRPLHRTLDVVALPEVGAEVLPAGIREHGDDDALLELGRELLRDVDDGPGGDAGEDALLREQPVHAAHGLGVRDEYLAVEL